MLDLVFKNYITRSQSGRSNRRMTATRKSPGVIFFKKILGITIKELKIKDKKIEVSLNLVGETKIKELNNKYRNKNEVTDVLSFPLKESRLKKHDILPLGDIFICLPFAFKELKKSRLIGDPPMRRGLGKLTVHGFLHLLGYDHERSKHDATKMFLLESKILNKLKK